MQKHPRPAILSRESAQNAHTSLAVNVCFVILAVIYIQGGSPNVHQQMSVHSSCGLSTPAQHLCREAQAHMRDVLLGRGLDTGGGGSASHRSIHMR